MTYMKDLRIPSLLLAAFALGGCSSSSGGGNPDFPRIDASELNAALAAPAALSGDALAYQAALIYDTVIDLRGHDGLSWPLADAEIKSGRCTQGGGLTGSRFHAHVDSPYTDLAMRVDHSNAHGCSRFTSDGDTLATAVGQLEWAQREVCDDVNGCGDVVYGRYGSGGTPYRSQRLESLDNVTLRDTRVEIAGGYDDGFGDPLVETVPGENPGDPAVEILIPVYERSQRFGYINSVETVSARPGDSVAETQFSLQVGAGSEPLVRFEVPSRNEVGLRGELASASSLGGLDDDGEPIDSPCHGGRMQIDTIEHLTISGNNIVDGEIELSNGTDSATLVFEAGGDVTITGSDSASNTLTRGDIEALRSACIRKLPVRR
jgi:hypothetical protein